MRQTMRSKSVTWKRVQKITIASAGKQRAGAHALGAAAMNSPPPLLVPPHLYFPVLRGTADTSPDEETPEAGTWRKQNTLSHLL